VPSRIFAVIDVGDALMSDRPYRPAWSEEKVIESLRSVRGRHFDPEIVDIFPGKILPAAGLHGIDPVQVLIPVACRGGKGRGTHCLISCRIMPEVLPARCSDWLRIEKRKPPFIVNGGFCFLQLRDAGHRIKARTWQTRL
jgi:hypothetical protein